jgi:ABC-type transport system involved in multi-copper enzyme maturation permease subunit
MTTIVDAPHRTAVPSSARQSFPNLLRAEWIGFWSLRGNVASLIIGAVLAIALSVGFSAFWGFATTRPDEALPSDAAPPLISMALNGFVVLQAVAVLLGVSAFAKEHSTGSLRTQLAAAPDRIGMLGAKAAVGGAVTFVWTVAVTLVCAAGVAVMYGIFDLPVSFEAPLTEVALPILGTAVFVALSGILAVAVAALLRSETWAVTLVLLFLLLLPTVLLSLPFEWAPPTAELLMGQTGQTLLTAHEAFDAEILKDIAITVAWPVLALLAAMAVVRRRDA